MGGLRCLGCGGADGWAEERVKRRCEFGVDARVGVHQDALEEGLVEQLLDVVGGVDVRAGAVLSQKARSSMSRQLLSRSPDLQRLLDEGFEIRFVSNMLFVGVPYVTRTQEIARGWLVTDLNANGDQTTAPTDHTAHFVGATNDPEDQPCDSAGQPLTGLMNVPKGPIQVATDVIASCCFSQKPPSGHYADYYEKMTTYGAILLSEVHAVDPTVKIPNYAPMATEESESVHRYFDSATSRARIGAVSDKTRNQKVGIIGLGGTGSYILDALVKTHVAEIHLYDGDDMKAHNAFRAPGAMSLEALQERPLKVDHHQRLYDVLHRHVIAHPAHISEGNVDELRGLDFVFISIDAGPAKRLLVDKLREFGIPFVDTGMGIDQTGDSLVGIVRTTRLVSGQGTEAWIDENLSFADAEDDEYDRNIQIVELNMLNAALSVISWKKHIGFYRDFRHEMESNYTIDGSLLSNSGGDDEK